MAGVSAPSRLLSIDQALALVAAHVTELPAEQVALQDAYGRFIAEDLQATIDLPPFASSAMDGYALSAADTPGRLTVVGESAAGSPYLGSLGGGESVVISTGAVVPPQADAVVPIEDVSGSDQEITVPAGVTPGAFVRARGSDVQRGEALLDAAREWDRRRSALRLPWDWRRCPAAAHRAWRS